MAPTKATAEDDPITASYDVYLTPSQQEQLYLLQYLNRSRDRPYSQHYGARPTDLRIKPKSGYLELEVSLSTEFNFNKYQGLKWGDALQTARTIQNEGATYGPAAGLGAPRRGLGSRGPLKDKADRELQISNALTEFKRAEEDGKVMHKQTLGGQIMRHEDAAAGQALPVYYLGAFQGDQLHLSKVDGTIQMRPQFHHIDAEEHRNRLVNVRAPAEGEVRPPPVARGLQQSYKPETEDKDKDAPERKMRKALQDAEEESWVPLEYVDEAEDTAYDAFNEKMFLHNVDAAPKLKSTMDEEQLLDAVSGPSYEGSGRKKRRPRKRRGGQLGDEGLEEDEEAVVAAGEALPAEEIIGTAGDEDAMEGVVTTA
nr:hypothetical protein B0A51_02222 [Rachicladosporium sp. CCFEE 5018]